MLDIVDFALAKHLERVSQSLRHIAEHLVHLLLGFEPLLLGVEHSGRVIQIPSGGQTDKAVVRLGILLVYKVTIV